MLHKITYILNVGVNQQDNSAAVNRCRAFQQGLESNGISSEVFFPYSNKFKNRYKAKIAAFASICKYFINAKRNETIIFYGDSFFIFLIFFLRWMV